MINGYFMKYIIIWSLVIALTVVHQDNWLWDNDKLVFGILPIGLLSHIGISLGAAIVWFLAILFVWPHELEVEPKSQGNTEA